MNRLADMTLARRLMITQVLGVLIMAVTIVVVAGFIGPREFHRHMAETGHALDVILPHAEMAFRAAGLTALAAGVTIAAIGTIAASVLVTQPISQALRALQRGAERVSVGDYSTPVELPTSDRELAQVVSGFNAMAGRIDATEQTRRRMLTDLSHEIRTPLAAIDLLAESMVDGVLPVNEATLARLRAQTGRLARLASDIRDVSAAEEGHLELQPTSTLLTDLIASAVEVAQPSYADHGVALLVEPVPDLELQIDRSRVGQVLDNLLRNARQHSPKGSSVHLWVRQVDDQVAIGVRDQGSGITADELTHVFERFFTGAATRHDQGAGTGVGLAISRAIVHAHGGTLTATSDGPGSGAEFVVTLPATSSSNLY